MNATLNLAIERLEAVLCDPHGKACVLGAASDNAGIDASLDVLRALANSGDAQAVATLDASKIVSVTRAFDYLGNNEHTPWVKVCFPTDDWAARDAFAKSIARPPAPAESATGGEELEAKQVADRLLSWVDEVRQDSLREVLHDAAALLQRTTPAIAPQHAELVEKYNELIMAVAKKFPNETRHQTALRYINERETPSNNTAALSGGRSA